MCLRILFVLSGRNMYYIIWTCFGMFSTLVLGLLIYSHWGRVLGYSMVFNLRNVGYDDLKSVLCKFSWLYQGKSIPRRNSYISHDQVTENKCVNFFFSFSQVIWVLSRLDCDHLHECLPPSYALSSSPLFQDAPENVAISSFSWDVICPTRWLTKCSKMMM